MNFTHDPYQPGETIAALATPPGEGGVAIIRISGDRALDVANKVFSGPLHEYATHTAHYGYVIDGNGEYVDGALVLPMLGKRSFTGEDTVELHCHGGSLISRRVLECVLVAGARAARPGEFTFKAFINGKIDLTQAEAVQELISAKNEHALEAAGNQLRGRLNEKVSSFQKKLNHLAAILEAWVDFPEEGLEFASFEEVTHDLETIASEMQSLVDTFREGRIVHDGLAICFAGSPNVGKSSLMNALLDKERAIVSHIPGTTRDIVDDHMHLNGWNTRLIDTAGIRVTSECIEEEGIRRSHGAMEGADLILLVLDASRGVTEEDRILLEKASEEKTIALWNKCDLPHGSLPPLPMPHVAKVSAKTREGLEDLRTSIDKVIWTKGPPPKDQIMITNVRHKEALEKAVTACRCVVEGLCNQVSPEFLTMDMRKCLQELGKIIGSDITEDILSDIFSTFCIGK